MREYVRGALLGATALSAAGLSFGMAIAQDVTPNPAAAPPPITPTNEAAVQNRAATMGEVVVTARRRNETLTNVPISMSVVTAAKLEQLDLRGTGDIANYVPSLTFNNFTQGDARNDAGPDRPIIIRGLDLGFGNEAGAGLFLDGAAVIGNEVPASFDIGQVEVLRGPQSVYFGRATLSGAVSYRTRAISDHWEAEIEGVAADQDERDLQATIAGPIIPGVLKLRVTGLSDSYGGYETNTFPGSSQDLGATQRNSVSATAIFTPTSTIEIKGYVNYFRDNDGPAATAFVPENFDNCKLPGALSSTFCGEIPGKSHSEMYSNTSPGQHILDTIYNTPVIAGAGFKEKIGTQREVLNTDIVANWNINGYLRASSITGYHTNVDMSADDGAERAPVPNSFFPYQDYFYSYATQRKDFSQEFRLSSDPAQRLSWTAGVNFIRQTQAISADASTIGYEPSSTFDYLQPVFPSSASTYGVFGGVYYKVTDKLDLSAEGRFQDDQINQEGLSAVTHAFTPRVSATYDIGGHRRIYTSYAEGSEPAGFNVSVAANEKTLTGATLTAFNQQVASLLGTVNSAFNEERLRIGELGVKGDIFGGRGFFDLNGYYGQLSDQQVYESALIPALGYSVSATNNAGESIIYGIEWQGNYNFTHDLSVSTTFSWNHTDRSQYTNVAGVNQFGTTDFSGKEFPYVPQFTGSLVGSYTHEIVEGWNGYGNGAVTYRGKQYVDEFNAAYIPERFQVDVRAGVQHGDYTLEVFCKNLLNDQNYTGGSVAADYGTSNYNQFAFFGGFAPPRQVGVRALAKF